MIKSKTVLHHKIGEREYNLELSPDSPLGEIHDVLVVMRSFILEKMKEIDQKDEAKSECDAKQCQNCE